MIKLFTPQVIKCCVSGSSHPVKNRHPSHSSNDNQDGKNTLETDEDNFVVLFLQFPGVSEEQSKGLSWDW